MEHAIGGVNETSLLSFYVFSDHHRQSVVGLLYVVQRVKRRFRDNKQAPWLKPDPLC